MKHNQFDLKTRRLTKEVGVEVLDIDLRELDGQGQNAIQKLWQNEPLVLVRNQVMDDRELANFFYSLGEPLADVTRQDGLSRYEPGVVLISNLHHADGVRLGVLGDGEVVWHTDQCYRQHPATGSMFYAVEMPPEAGRTMWANLHAAYQQLDPAVAAKIKGRRGLFKYEMYKGDVTDTKLKEEIEEKTPPVWHPLVLTLPHDGSQSLYFDPTQTSEIEGLSKDESAEILATIRDHILQPQFIYVHSWHIGDVMLWDNARLLHRREDFDPKYARLAKRLTAHLSTELFAHPGRSA